jgi:hypothetical protein
MRRRRSTGAEKAAEEELEWRPTLRITIHAG